MDNKLFSEMSLELKGDYVFKKGVFISTREYGFLKMALYEIGEKHFEVIMEKEPLKITDIVQIDKSKL